VIISKGIHRSINALLALIKYKNKALKMSTPLIGLLTVYIKCCGELDFWYKANYINQIINRTPGSLILSLLDKEVKGVVLMDMNETVAIDGQ
jgi:hypothetical protein